MIKRALKKWNLTIITSRSVIYRIIPQKVIQQLDKEIKKGGGCASAHHRTTWNAFAVYTDSLIAMNAAAYDALLPEEMLVWCFTVQTYGKSKSIPVFRHDSLTSEH